MIGELGDEDLRDRSLRSGCRPRSAAPVPAPGPRRPGKRRPRISDAGSPARGTGPAEESRRRRHPRRCDAASPRGRDRSVLDIDHRLDPRQVARQSDRGSLDAWRLRLSLGRRLLLGLGMACCLDLLRLLESEVQLILGQALGAASEAVTLELLDDLASRSLSARSASSIALSWVGIVRQGLAGSTPRWRSSAAPTCDRFAPARNSLCRISSAPSVRRSVSGCVNAPPIEAFEQGRELRRAQPNDTVLEFGQRNSPPSSRFANTPRRCRPRRPASRGRRAWRGTQTPPRRTVMWRANNSFYVGTESCGGRRRDDGQGRPCREFPPPHNNQMLANNWRTSRRAGSAGCGRPRRPPSQVLAASSRHPRPRSGGSWRLGRGQDRPGIVRRSLRGGAGGISRPHERHEILCGGEIRERPALAVVTPPPPHNLARHIRTDRTHLLAHQCRQALCAFAEVDRPGRHHHTDRAPQADHAPAFSARITAATVFASAPPLTRTVTPSISTSMMPLIWRPRRRL